MYPTPQIYFIFHCFFKYTIIIHSVMYKIDIINCNTKDITEAYLFLLSIANKSSTADNIGTFSQLLN